MLVSIDECHKPHVLKLIDWLFNEVISAGGDGDGLWYSTYYDVKSILPLVEEYNNKLEYKWTVELKEDSKTIYWHDNQEGITITNNEDTYKSRPNWWNCVIIN